MFLFQLYLNVANEVVKNVWMLLFTVSHLFFKKSGLGNSCQYFESLRHVWLPELQALQLTVSDCRIIIRHYLAQPKSVG